MKVTINIAQLADPEIMNLALKFKLSNGKGESPNSNGDIVYILNNTGESFFLPDDYALCNSNGVRIDYATLFTVLPETTMDNLVPVDWPDSKEIDAEGVETRRVYQDYFKSRWQLDDGTYLVQVVHGIHGLTDTDRKIYEADLGTLLVKSEGVALIPPVTEP